ncbi:hypothetical protein JCM8547_006819 [Rhodosporidiobolus lusitaniae]
MRTSVLAAALLSTTAFASPLRARSSVVSAAAEPTLSSSTGSTASSESSDSSSTYTATSNASASTSTATVTSSATVTPTRAAPSGWTYKGCYPNYTYGKRTIRNLVDSSKGSWTIEKCIAAANSDGYAVAGITYGGECWGSNTVPSGTAQDSSSCNWKCADNAQELCGGSSSLDVYVASTTDKLIDDANWSYTGCYLDNVDGKRTLTGGLYNVGGKWTVSDCLSAVKAARLSVGGLEYGGECWGGVEIANYASSLGKQAASKCSMPCNDNAQLSCGGNNSLDVYTLKTAATKVWTDETYDYLGCYTDAGNGNTRTLSTLISGRTKWDVQTCLDSAAGQYKYAGLIYGGECWVGDEIAAGAPTSSSRCAWTCSDDSLVTCGGESAMDIYVVESA